MALVFMFPGQNSRYPGMIAKFAGMHPANSLLLKQASDILHRDLAAHFREDNPLQFARNRDVQVGVFLASHLLLRSLQREGVDARWSLGLSLGEYNHLVHIGALALEHALPLLEARGDAYDETPRGAMASVFPIELQALDARLRAAGVPGVCSIALHNSPRQQVLSGHRGSILRVVESLDNDFIEHAFIDDRLAMHSSLMWQASLKFRQSLEETPWTAPWAPYLPNATGRFLAHPARHDFVDLLTRHIHQPVLWRESLEVVTSTAPQPILVEIGPGGILQAMAGRRWLTCPVQKTDVEDEFEAHFENLVQELKVGQRELAIAHSRG